MVGLLENSCTLKLNLRIPHLILWNQTLSSVLTQGTVLPPPIISNACAFFYLRLLFFYFSSATFFSSSNGPDHCLYHSVALCIRCLVHSISILHLSIVKTNTDTWFQFSSFRSITETNFPG